MTSIIRCHLDICISRQCMSSSISDFVLMFSRYNSGMLVPSVVNNVVGDSNDK